VLIFSIYSSFCLRNCPDGIGFFCFQNRGARSTFRIEIMQMPWARQAPFHTIIPSALSLRWKPICELGLMGGSVQPQGHAQDSNEILVDFGMRSSGSRRMHLEWGIAGVSQPYRSGWLKWWYAQPLKVDLNPKFFREHRKMGHLNFFCSWYLWWVSCNWIDVGQISAFIRCFCNPKRWTSSKVIKIFTDKPI